MTIDEASQAYNIPIAILREYEGWGLCAEVKKVMGDWQYDDTDLERLGMIMTLHDIGFSNEEVKEYMELFLSGESTEGVRMAMLNKHRSITLDEIHFQEKKLGKMDYLRHEIAKAMK
ncbi:MAG: MerR family transcriptional regulator [Christensenella sp.]|uniref:MerR family transcriptional regulator n=1 Tax=Christensenella sp. TaxID=1935934 RepID=UPI002B1E9955|nr:MerR family transcriptional regulator [Christensenella sp.]MEA5002495.1 MerR family transcriptional regulator [Christensenella sp.]